MKLGNLQGIFTGVENLCEYIENENTDISYIKETIGSLNVALGEEYKAKGANLQADIQERKLSPYCSKKGLQQSFDSMRTYFSSVITEIKTILKDLEDGWYNYKGEDRKVLISGLKAILKDCKALSEICLKAFDDRPSKKPTTVRQLISTIVNEDTRKEASELAEKLAKTGYLDEDYFPTENLPSIQKGLIGRALGNVCGGYAVQIGEIWGFPSKRIHTEAGKADESNSKAITTLKSILGDMWSKSGRKNPKN